MKKKLISLLIPVVLLTSSVVAEEVVNSSAKEFTLPAEFAGQEKNSTEGSTITIDDKNVWEIAKIWPDGLKKISNYKPMEWLGSNWGSTTNSHGGQPGIKITKSIISLSGRSAWPGNSGVKAPALIFNCHEAGTYSVSANINYNTWDGEGKGAFLLLKVSNDEITVVTKHTVNDKKGDFDFSATDIALKDSDKLIFTMQFNSRSATSYTMRNFAIKLEGKAE